MSATAAPPTAPPAAIPAAPATTPAATPKRTRTVAPEDPHARALFLLGGSVGTLTRNFRTLETRTRQPYVSTLTDDERRHLAAHLHYWADRIERKLMDRAPVEDFAWNGRQS